MRCLFLRAFSVISTFTLPSLSAVVVRFVSACESIASQFIHFQSSTAHSLFRKPAMASYEMQPSKGFTDTASPAMSSPMHSDHRVGVDATGTATGTDADALDMARMGRSQELRRNFKSLSVFGLAITTMSTWMGMLFGNAFSLTNGGLAGTIWVYFVSWMLTFTLAASLAEMASMAPTSGGQYR
jgi:amino acid permease